MKKRGSSSIPTENGAAGDSFVEHGPGSKIIGDIPVTTVDKMVAELARPRVDLIKADI